MHELGWARYNADIMSHGCLKCGVEPLQRCRGAMQNITPAHMVRVKAAGYKWNGNTRRLEKV